MSVMSRVLRCNQLKDGIYIFAWLKFSAVATPAVMLSQAVIWMTNCVGWKLLDDRLYDDVLAVAPAGGR